MEHEISPVTFVIVLAQFIPKACLCPVEDPLQQIL
jgi:hypothetical protein